MVTNLIYILIQDQELIVDVIQHCRIKHLAITIDNGATLFPYSFSELHLA